MFKAVILRCICQAVATPMRVPCPRHDVARLVPCLCRAMSAMSLSLLLQCCCKVVDMSWPCHRHAFYHDRAMVLPCPCHVFATLVTCPSDDLCHDGDVPMRR